MSLFDYHYSLRKLSVMDPPFYALIMAAMRKADGDNLARLKHAFPEVWLEFGRRYNAKLGVLPEDNVEIPLEELQKRIEQSIPVEEERRGDL